MNTAQETSATAVESNRSSTPTKGYVRASPPRPTFEELNLDPGIRPVVQLFMEHGIDTFESCQGGEGHCFADPTVRFEGGPAEGFRAYALATYHGYEVADLRRCWEVVDHELTGPFWEITFVP